MKPKKTRLEQVLEVVAKGPTPKKPSRIKKRLVVGTGAVVAAVVAGAFLKPEDRP